MKILVATLALTVFTALAALPAHVQSQTYPNKPIRIVVPYTAGGATDAVTATKAHPGVIKQALASTGTLGHLAGELLAKGSAPISGTAAQATQFIQTEHAQWAAVVREAEIKLD